jgi:Domain of unknown function (DUF222)/HNH endonuclease
LVVYTPDTVPPELSDVLSRVRRWSQPDARDHLAATSADERAAWVVGLQQLADAVATAALAAVDAFDAHGDGARLHGASSTQSWIRGACRVTGAEANERVRLARASRDALSEATALTTSGAITYDHLRAVERGIRPLPPEHQQEAARLLTDLASAAPVGDVRAAGRHLRHVVDPDGAFDAHEQQFERRFLTLSPLMDGMSAVDGLLDAESAALLTRALEPFLVPSDPDDRRSTSQRRADGLVQIVQSACDHRLLPLSGGERPHLQILVDPRATHLPWPPPARLSSSEHGVLPPASVERVSCDCQLTPLLLDDRGIVTDLGRTRRLFSPKQRQLLSIRDGGCRFPGCSRSPAHTDAHHIVPWAAGGTTDSANALLLCRHHHRLVHEGGWTVEAVDLAAGGVGPVRFIGPHGQRLSGVARAP